MKEKLIIWMFVAAVVLVPSGVYGIVKWYEQSYTRLPVLGEPGHLVSDFTVRDQYGKQKGLQDWKGKIVVANLFFTHCPVVCPKMIRNLKTVRKSYAGDTGLLLASFSVDPVRDSSSRLKEFAGRMHIEEGWQLLTGDKREIYRLARKSLLAVATDGDGGEGDFIHSEQLVLIDPDQRIRGFYKGTEEEEAKKLFADIKRLKKEYAH